MSESRTRTRMRVLAMLVAFMFAALSARLWFLQVLASESFAKQADQNQVRLVPIAPLRGEVLDRHGRVLIGNRPSTIITVDRQELNGQEEGVLFRLSSLLKIPVQDLVTRLDSVKYLPYQPVPVAEDVSKDVVFYIEEHRDLFPGVSYQVGSVRAYPFGTLAAQVLGWTGEISDPQLKEPQFAAYRPGSIVGKAGVEAQYEQDLYGTDGVREIQVNAQGQVLDQDFGGQAAVPGSNVVLSLDTGIQQLAEQSLAAGIDVAHHTIDGTSGRPLRAPGGAVLVLDPRTGSVLAMASNPTYDPAIFTGGLSTKEARTLDLCGNCPATHNQPLLNRATQGLYPAGSTFKPFVAAAALHEGFAKVDGSYNCPSGWSAPIDRTHHIFHNWSTLDYGYMSLSQALTISCDTVFYQLGYQFWRAYWRSPGRANELMQRDLAAMGFGRRTGIDLPGEQAGLVPTADYVKRVFKSNPSVYGKFYGWLPGDAVNLSIGQGFLQVTPLQLATAYAAIANGGALMRPHVVDRIQASDGHVIRRIAPVQYGQLPVSKRQLTYLRNALANVPRVGTASVAFQGFPLDRIPVAGKTGTADIIPQQPYSWFAAMAPVNHPRYVVVCMVEQGGHGSTTAAPIVRRVLEGLFGLRPVPVKAGSTVD